MKAYTGFAQVYDTFMDNVPYDEWADYLTGLLQEYGVKDGLVLELGCGTGNVTRRLAKKGYDMIGIDNSIEMLEIAREKEYDFDMETENLYDADFQNEREKSNPILYLLQDMRDFELYGTVGAVVSICDSINYITSEEDLLKVFRLVNNYLDPGGIFIFDMNTEYKYKTLLGDKTIAENREECSFIWENYYDEKRQVNEYNVTIFVKAEKDDTDNGGGNNENDLFVRFQETHYQKAYSIERIKDLLLQAGMEFVAVYDAFTRNKPDEHSERVYFIAKEKYQKNKKYIKI
ncbi:MAG: Glycine/sarcosine N-methyltransferase [Lachnoclostridium sp.]|jgi:SAM-dependent methyltransferase